MALRTQPGALSRPLRRYARIRGLASAPSATDRAMMARALELAQAAAAQGEVPVGAVVFETKTGALLGEGSNTRASKHDPAGHAEFIAIQRACTTRNDWRLNDCTLVVTLEPCAMCAGLIVNARVGRVIFGALDPKAGAVCSLYHLLEDPRLNHRAQVLGGVEAEASTALLREFFRARRRR